MAWHFVLQTTDVPGSTRCRVIAKLQPGLWRVVVGAGAAPLDGGVECDWPKTNSPPVRAPPNANSS